MLYTVSKIAWVYSERFVKKMEHRLYQSVICSRLTYVCHFHGILHSTLCNVLECAMLRILKQEWSWTVLFQYSRSELNSNIIEAYFLRDFVINNVLYDSDSQSVRWLRYGLIDRKLILIFQVAAKEFFFVQISRSSLGLSHSPGGPFGWGYSDRILKLTTPLH
jgi:hypothetical protein